MNPKSSYSCSLCSKVVNEPLELECGDAICAKHYQERDTHNSKLKCLKCDAEFDLNHAKPFPKMTKQFFSDFLFLTEEERSLKAQIEANIKMFFQYNDEFPQRLNELDVSCHDRFQEIIRQIDLHREEEIPKVYNGAIIKRINEYSLELIESVKIFEASYLQNFDLKYENPPSKRTSTKFKI